MARKIGYSVLAMLVAFLIGIALITAAGAVVIAQGNAAAPAQVIPAP